MVNKFCVWDEENGNCVDNCYVVEAIDYENAAEEWARLDDCDSAEYSIVSGRATPTVCVKREGTTEVKRFVVRGEAHPVYSADYLNSDEQQAYK